MYMFVYIFSPYSTIFQLYDGVKFLLVEERTQIYYTVWKNHQPSTSKLTNFLTQSHRSEQDSNREVSWYETDVLTTQPRGPLLVSCKTSDYRTNFS
jgi:hypothetical protein